MNNYGSDNPNLVCDIDDSGKQVGHKEDFSSRFPNSSDVLFEDNDFEGDYIGKLIESFWSSVNRVLASHSKLVRTILLALLFLLYNLYLIVSLHQGVSKKASLDFCSDVGFLFILTIIVYTGLSYYYIIKPLYRRLMTTEQGIKIHKSLIIPISRLLQKMMNWRHIRLVIALTFMVILKVFIIHDTSVTGDYRRLVSYLGIWLIVLLGLLFSAHPGHVVWRHVLWGLGLQFLMGLLILRWSLGKAVFDCIGSKVKTFLDYTDAGSGFVFGYLVTQQPFYPGALNGTTAKLVTEEINNSKGIGFVFMFKVLSIIYFFNFMVSILFHLGAMNWLVSKIGWLLQLTVGTTACESMNAAGNIFLGQTEAPLLIKPYLTKMTKSEIHAVMTGGFATIAGSVLAAYISFGIDASHLLSASVMSAPAALAFSKLFYPETKKSKTSSDILPKVESKYLLLLQYSIYSFSLYFISFLLQARTPMF